MANTANARAVAKLLRSSDALQSPDNAPLLQLVRTLARQMDSAGPDPSTRLSAAYLSALKDVRRVIETERAAKRTAQKSDKAKALESMRARNGAAIPSHEETRTRFRNRGNER